MPESFADVKEHSKQTDAPAPNTGGSADEDETEKDDEKALKYMKDHKVSYAEAYTAVKRNKEDK